MKTAVPLPARLFRSAAEHCGLPRSRFDPLIDALTSGFDPRWLARNQKFDVSFSGTPRPSLRLSYNGFGEESAFRDRLPALAERLGGAPLKALWENILRTETLRNELSYFALDWAADAEPRAKIQMWEVSRERARAFASAAGFDGALREGGPVRAISLATQGRASVLTTYHDAPLREARAWAARWGAAAPLERFVGALGREPRAFGLLSLSRDPAGREISAGWYKIYESPRGMTEGALAETQSLWTEFGESSGLRERTLEEWADSALKILVVAAALKFSESRPPRITLYYSAAPEGA